jgi:hypothetical protein
MAPGGAAAVMVAPVIASRIEPRAEDEGIRVWWEFSEPARRVLQDGDHFAAMNRATLLAFESRYAVTLYERSCLLAGRCDPRWRGTVDEFRSLLGVPAGAYRTWGNIRQKVVDPALAEVNLLADFEVSCRIENGPHNKTVAVELWFLPKPPAARDAAAAEIKRPRVGRKARRHDAPLALRSPKDLGWDDHVIATASPRRARKPS